jgi:putative ABC transport system ATP-binding protein
MPAVLECQDLRKSYGQGALAEPVLHGVTLALGRGEACVLLGPSGSGKTTLLSIFGCLLSPTSGALRIDGRVVDHAAPGQLVRLRRRQIGFVFQHAQLLPFLSVEQNIALVGRNAGLGRAEVARRVDELLARLDLAGLRGKTPDRVSGGQRQRVALARALVHRPPLILADEPTASLDWGNGQVVVRLLVEQARADHALLIAVTHDTRLLKWFDRVFHIDSGRVQEQ